MWSRRKARHTENNKNRATKTQSTDFLTMVPRQFNGGKTVFSIDGTFQSMHSPYAKKNESQHISQILNKY